MTSNGPWSVKGIESQTREMAKHAARRSGMTIGEWLNTVISEQADGNDDERSAAGTMTTTATSPSADSFERATTRLEDIAQQLARIARHETDAASAYSYGAPPSRSDNESITRLLNRVESNERQAVEAFSAVNERLSVLGRQFAQATKAATARPDESQGFQTLEKAVRNIIEHMESSEKRNRDNFRSLQDRFSELSSKSGQSPAISQFETRLSDLSRRVEASESTASRGLPDIVRQELHDLANRIDTVRETAEQLATRAQTQAVQASQQELRSIEQRILGLLNEAQSTFRHTTSNPADLEHLRDEIGQINTRIDDARRGAASDQDVRALRQAVEQLSSRVQQNSDSRPLVEMDRRIVELAQRLQQVQSTQPTTELEQRFAELEHRVLNGQQDNNGAAVQQHLQQFAERMDRTEKQITHFETIERAITQLYEGLEQTRNSAKQVAEDAASRVAAQFAHLQPQSFSLAGAPEIAALEHGMQSLREAASSSDQRNQDTLVAVHDTLEHIVTKLAELETAAIGQRVAAAVHAPVDPVAQEIPDFAMAEPAIQHSTQFADPEAQVEFNAIAEDIQPEPQEPYLEIPAESLPSDSLGQLEIGSVSVQTETAETHKKADGDDFIAAARRAAQAAQTQRGVLGGLTSGGARKGGKTSRSLFSAIKLPFLKSGKAKAAHVASSTAEAAVAPLKPMPEIKPAQSTVDAAKRRKLMLVGLLLLAAVPALLMNFNGKPATPMAPAATPAPVETPASPAPTKAQPAAEKQSELLPTPNAMPELSESDSILTGSVEAPGTNSVAEVVSGDAPPDALAMLPSAIGSQKLKTAAAAGDAKAQYVVASRFADGKGITQDLAQAAYWFGKAASAGLAPAQYRIATMFERGHGVDKDVKAALAWYERAAALGNVRSMHNAAVIAANTEAGQPDYARAFKWFSLASSHGLKDSQFNLAVLMERGLGTEANVADAVFWYSAAGLQNDTDAQRRADFLTPTLSSAQVEQVKARLASWKAQIAPREANVFEAEDSLYLDKSANIAPVANEIIVGRVQDMLTQLGYNVGKMDGQLSARTTNAIKLFQIEAGLVADGQVTPDLVGSMEARLG